MRQSVLLESIASTFLPASATSFDLQRTSASRFFRRQRPPHGYRCAAGIHIESRTAAPILHEPTRRLHTTRKYTAINRDTSSLMILILRRCSQTSATIPFISSQTINPAVAVDYVHGIIPRVQKMVHESFSKRTPQTSSRSRTVPAML